MLFSVLVSSCRGCATLCGVTLHPFLPCRPDVLPWLTLRVTPFVCIVGRDEESPVSPPWQEPWFTCTTLVQCILTLRKRLVKVRVHASDP